MCYSLNDQDFTQNDNLSFFANTYTLKMSFEAMSMYLSYELNMEMVLIA